MQVTRQRIVDHLHQQNSATVDQLTAVIGLTHMAVRHHLNVLMEQGLVEVSMTRRTSKPGRPVQIYTLTEQGLDSKPQDYFQLSDLLVNEMVQQLGADGIETIFNNIAGRILQLAPQCVDADSFEKRLDKTVYFLREQGFATRWSIEDGQYIIHHETCPYRQLATRHQEVCLLDEILIESMLHVKPTRTHCIANQDEQCSYCLGVFKPDPAQSNSAVETVEL